MKAKKIFITGATGYIGHELALFIAKKGFLVHALVRNIESKRIPRHESIKIFKGDICDLNSIKPAIAGCDYVFHTAAYTDLRCSQIESFYCANVQGTKNVLEAALEINIEKFIFTSTLSIYGPALFHVPITEEQPRIESIGNDYELTKLMSEELVTEYTQKGLSTCILNVSRVYGPGLLTYSNGINRLVLKFMKNQTLITPNKLESEANYVFIQDVLNAHYAVLENPDTEGKYIIGGENADYNRLFSLIKKIVKSKTKIFRVNYKLMSLLVLLHYNFNKLLGLKTLVTPKIITNLFKHRSASSNKAIKQLNYRITPLKVGLERTANHLKFI
jgi:nucleoside-diphosphate-sugar epimerase